MHEWTGLAGLEMGNRLNIIGRSLAVIYPDSPSNTNGLPKVVRGEDTPELIAGKYGCWTGVKIRVVVIGRHSSVLGALGSWEGKGLF